MSVLRRDQPTRQQVLRPVRGAVRERRRAALRVAGVLHPRHLAEKILTSKTALEGERKQVTVLFADLKGSMELLADRDGDETMSAQFRSA